MRYVFFAWRLGSVFETGTLFFLAAGSYFVGIVIREMGMKMSCLLSGGSAAGSDFGAE